MNDILDFDLLGLVESLICRCRRLVSWIAGLSVHHPSEFGVGGEPEIASANGIVLILHYCRAFG